MNNLSATVPAILPPPLQCAKPSPDRPRSGMRAVLFDPDPVIRERLLSCLENQNWCAVYGVADCWSDCRVLLDEYVPDILVARLDACPAATLHEISASIFPAVLGMGLPPSSTLAADLFDVLPPQPTPEEITGSLQRLWLEVCHRKAMELAQLLQRYLECSDGEWRPLEFLRVGEDASSFDLPVSQVLYTCAAGNYVKVHSSIGDFEIRSTMEKLANELPRASFLRVHRSYIVNLDCVKDVRSEMGIVTSLLMSDGVECPVGRSFRMQTAGRLLPAA